MFTRLLRPAWRVNLTLAVALSIFVCLPGIFSICAQDKVKADGKPAKYVFLMIGDGMGVNQRLAAEKCLPEKGAKLVMDSFPYSALTTTNSTVDVTDSAAAGTALACGVKTKNGVLGLDKDGKRVESISELLKKKGMKIGIMTNTPINHATPAAFFAHSAGRGSYSEISTFVPEAGFELFVGDDFLMNKDDKKPDAMLKEKGYTLLNNAEAFRKLQKDAGKVIFTYRITSAPISAEPKKITLAECLVKATELLENDKGFFIMMEGGMIDWACHANDLYSSVQETLAFDDAIKVAHDFYLKHPSETLIVVSADHETGGLGLDSSSRPELFMSQKFAKSEIINRVNDCKKGKASFEEVLKTVQESFGMKDLTDAETKSIRDAYDALMETSPSDTRAEEIKKMYGTKNPVVEACTKILCGKAGVTWSTGGHTSSKVKTTAIGAGAELFSGEMDNTEIPARIKKAMSVE
jgi:alkaline phosphatase